MTLGSSLADMMVTQKSKGSSKIEKIHGLVNWKRFGYRLEKILGRSGLGPTGYDPIQMFKVLVLQNLYGLSDPEMEEMLYDRLSFRRFCGFQLSDKIPDETTICRFRSSLKGHTEKLFKLVMEDISGKGIRLQSGAILDATIVRSSVCPPCGGEVSEKDPEAGWSKKRDEYIYGYKVHVSSDHETGLIKRVVATSADVHDSQVFGQLLTGKESEVYADKAYGSKRNREVLREHGIKDRLMYKATRGRKQPRWQIDLNRLWSSIRCNIERTFGCFKTQMGITRARYKGWEKNQVHFDLVAIAYNLSRTASILSKSTG